MPTAKDRKTIWALTISASLVALVSLHTVPQSNNDKSRLALVEALVERHTFCIDETRYDTTDKVFVDGHFYSDKPPTQSILLAGPYWISRTLFGLSAAENPRLYYYFLNLCSSGLSYVVAVVFFFRATRSIRLEWRDALLLTLSLGLATVLPAFLRDINSHIVVLALGIVMLQRVSSMLATSEAPGRFACSMLGLLGGLAYALEQPCGGLLMGGMGCLLLIHYRRLEPTLYFLLGTVPFVVLHHGIVYHLAGTFSPINADPKHFDYPGTDFDATNMTGRWTHASFFVFVRYAFVMLIGDRGFVQCNLLLFLAIPAIGIWLYRHGGLVFQRTYDSPNTSEAGGSPTRTWQGEHLVVLFCTGWMLLTYLVYAMFSTGLGGVALSVRWFVPLLAPAYYVLALLLRDHPKYRMDCVLLTLGGFVLGGLMWWGGAWTPLVPCFWWIQGATFAGWVVFSPHWPRLIRLGRI